MIGNSQSLESISIFELVARSLVAPKGGLPRASICLFWQRSITTMHVLFTYLVKRLNFSFSHASKLLSKAELRVMDYVDLKTFSHYNETNYEVSFRSCCWFFRQWFCTVLHFKQVAVETLNSLQSNASVLEKARLQKDRQAITNVPFTEKYLNRIGISIDKIDQQLKIIHVSGTKVHEIFNHSSE